MRRTEGKTVENSLALQEKRNKKEKQDNTEVGEKQKTNTGRWGKRARSFWAWKENDSGYFIATTDIHNESLRRNKGRNTRPQRKRTFFLST